MNPINEADRAVRIHETADVSPRAQIGEGTSIWHQAQIREGVRVGKQCIIGKGAYVDHDVHIGDRVKIQNYACVYHGARIEDGVFIGPHVCITNDKYPRAITPDGSLKDADDWDVGPVWVREGAALGAMSVVLPGVTVGRFALVGSCSVVTQDVPDHGMVMGNPARLKGFVCRCGRRLIFEAEWDDLAQLTCKACGSDVTVAKAVYALAFSSDEPTS